MHRTKPGLEPTVVGVHGVVRVLLKDGPSAAQQILDNPRVDRRALLR
jgi:hypothetical protein